MEIIFLKNQIKNLNIKLKNSNKNFDAHKQKVYVKLKLKSPIFQILGEYVVDKICPPFIFYKFNSCFILF